eukprot:sb/3463578/
MTQKVSTTFTVSIEDADKQRHYSHRKLFQGFFWVLCVNTSDPEYFGLYLHCEPVNSSKNWNCFTTFSLRDENTYSKAEYDFSDADQGLGYGWGKVMKKDKRKVIKIFAKIKITSFSFGKLEPIPPTVLFQLCLPLDTLGNIESSYFTSQEVNGRTWLFEVQKPAPDMIRLRVDGYSKETLNEENNQGESVTVLVKNNPNLKQTNLLGRFFDLNFEKVMGCSLVELTFIFGDSSSYNQPSMMNFGREYLSLPTHGNNSFLLKDNTSIPLNSLVLAHNSPVLKGFIEKEGELDHDVTDFEPEAVRIFADACYTGTLEKLSDETEFKIFSDFVKMVAVFKVDWAKGGCLEFYRKHLPKPSEDFTAYWSFAILALDSAVHREEPCFLNHLLSCVPENLTKFQFRLSKVLAELTKRSHLDLVMAMVIEFSFVNKFVEQILTLMMFKTPIPLLDYWFENFNFSLCDQETLSLFTETVGQSTNPETCRKCLAILKHGEVQRGTTEDGMEGTKEEEDGRDINMIPKDGTLATVARNLWSEDEESTWPCSTKRPFSLTRGLLD